jgi:hypothetical protein
MLQLLVALFDRTSDRFQTGNAELTGGLARIPGCPAPRAVEEVQPDIDGIGVRTGTTLYHTISSPHGYLRSSYRSSQ